MSRLIDVDELLSYIDRVKNSGLGKQKSLEYITKYISNMPTAFNVDKVVEKLEEQISKHDLLFNKYVKDKDKSCSWSISELNKIRGLLEAIDVVKAGGIDVES